MPDATKPTLEPSADAPGSAAIATGIPQRVEGERSYRVLHELGHGGMGSVYLAERADGEFRQQVAIKFLNPGVSPTSAQRFRAERQILADFDHPNVCRLLDGGTTADGRPFLVMEPIDGLPLDEYCDRLPLEERLRLFITVCRAVQAAHERRIVHRDLKPRNVLVDAHGIPKLLDFGIAKLLDPRPDEAVETTLGHAPLTLLYASPEQVRADPATTASDVYSLGVILYRLLTGTLPHGEEGLSLFQLASAILSREPARPTTVVRSPGVAVTTPRPKVHLDLDLDAITLRALRKEPEQRYPSALALAEDLERYLAGRPVLARPGTALYRARKLLRRKAGSFAVATLGLAAVVASAVVTYRLAVPRPLLAPGEEGRVAILPFHNATGSPANAWVEAGLAGLVSQLFGAAERVETVPAAEVEKAARHLAIGGGDPPEESAVARLCQALGADFAIFTEVALDPSKGFRLSYRLYSPRGVVARREIRARELTAAGGEMARRLLLRLDPESSDLELADRLSEDPLANTLYAMGLQELTHGNAKESQHYFSVALHRAPDLAQARLDLGRSVRRLGRWAEAEAAFREALATARARGDQRLATEALISLGNAADSQGNPGAALALFQQAVEILHETGDRRAMATVLNSLGNLSLRRGELDDAETSFTSSLHLVEQLRDLQAQAARWSNLALVASARGDGAQAETRFERALDLARQGAARDLEATTLNNLGFHALGAGDATEAEELHRRALEIAEELEDPASIALTLLNLAAARGRQADNAGAEELLTRALASSRAASDPRLEGHALANLSFYLAERGELAAAADAAREAATRATAVEDAALTLLANVNLAYAEIGRGDLTAALAPLRAAEAQAPRDSAVLRMRALYEYGSGRLRAALAAGEEAKRVAGPAWLPRHEAILETLRDAVRQGRRLPLPLASVKPAAPDVDD